MTQRKAIWALVFLFFLLQMAEARVSVMARPADWTRLDKFQKTITRETFAKYLREYYAPNGAASEYVRIDTDHALIRRGGEEGGFYRLDFAESEELRREVPVKWRPVTPGSLTGRKIAIDPGHIGGDWAKMEERWFKIGNSAPVVEGDMALLVAKKIAIGLHNAGAMVALVRSSNEPLTPVRPEILSEEATTSLKDKGVAQIQLTYTDQHDPQKQNSVQWEAERLFYRLAEIRARAKRNNEILKPDLTICVHFNAEAWGDPTMPTFVEKNHLHLLVNGQYGPEEIAYDDVRLEMLEKLLGQSINTELALSEAMAKSLATATGLPPYKYPSTNARLAPGSTFVWLRNLLANRLYRNPTLYLEPYVMNNLDTFDRIQMGDYPGTRLIRGVQRKSIYAEYADAVVEALKTLPAAEAATP
ncbi:MAG TPA: hypothetical protein VF585_01545 [Chthoniobacterales bacterium]|jgi:N-acetylmuramoyl-L-alanine amidase